MSTVQMTSLQMTTGTMSHGFAAPRLRLTQRGRGVLTFLAATPLVIAAFVFALNGGGATASLEGSTVPFEYVTVESGQSLWQLPRSSRLSPTRATSSRSSCSSTSSRRRTCTRARSSPSPRRTPTSATGPPVNLASDRALRPSHP